MNVFYAISFFYGVSHVLSSKEDKPEPDSPRVYERSYSRSTNVIIHVVKSSLELFVEAVQRSDMGTALTIFNSGTDELKQYCGECLVGKEKNTLLNLINIAHVDYKPWLLQLVLVHAGELLIDEVFSAVEPSNDIMRCIAESVDVVCIPQKFTYFLNKIGTKVEQVYAVEKWC